MHGCLPYQAPTVHGDLLAERRRANDAREQCRAAERVCEGLTFDRNYWRGRTQSLDAELRECRERCARLRSALASQPGWSHERVKQIEEGQIGE